jgi:hypothetical protein
MKLLMSILSLTLIITSCQENSTTQTENSVASSDSLKKEIVDSSSLNATDTASSTSLTITPLEIEGDLGQITFTQNGKTIFYYDLESKKGKVNLGGKEYALDKYNFNSGTYKLSGSNVNISAPNAKYKESEGGDCNYGKFAEVTITSGAETLKLKNVEVQDCPNY